MLLSSLARSHTAVEHTPARSTLHAGPTLLTAGSVGVMERSQATNTMTNGSKTSKNWKPYTGPTLLTAGSSGTMERSEATNTMTNGSKASRNWKPYTGPTMLTAGSAGWCRLRQRCAASGPARAAR